MKLLKYGLNLQFWNHISEKSLIIRVAMRFTINSKLLLNCLIAAGKAISNRPPVAILSCFRLTLEGNVLTLTASDTEIAVISSIHVSDVEGGGSICIDAKRLIELLKKIPECIVVFDVTDLLVTIYYINGKYSITGQPSEEYPLNDRLYNRNIQGVITLPTQQILSGIDKVSFAIANDKVRPQLNGIFWDITENAIVFVATDTHVLAKYRSTQTATGLNMSFILPARSLSLIRAYIVKHVEVKLILTDRLAVLEGKDYKIYVILVNGKYPAYNRVIPQRQPINIVADRTTFLNMVDRVSVCVDSQISLLRISISHGQLKAVAQDINYSVGAEECINCEYNEQKLEIGFNSDYLKGILNALSTSKIIINLSSPDKPALFLPSENEAYGELTLLCMPMRIPD